MTLGEKIKEAENILKLAAEMSKTYYHEPLIICYSGGKDSDVLLNIAVECLKPDEFEVLNNHTTVDAPETVYYIRDVFKHLNEKGIKTTIQLPRYKGKITSMWELIVLNGSYPTKQMRYCCRILKETGTPNRMAAVGVREDESLNRRGRDSFTFRAKKEDARYYSVEHVREQFENSKTVTKELGGKDNDVNAYDCLYIEKAKQNKDLVASPIYKFTERDIWDYIRIHKLNVNPLYFRGYKRIGCIGCPLAGPVRMQRDFALYPKYKQNYIKAFDKMLERRKKKGRPFVGAETGEQVMKLWLGENPKQIDLFELMEAEGDK